MGIAITTVHRTATETASKLILSATMALSALLAPGLAEAATVAVGPSCSLVNAVASVNQLSNVGGCVREGSGAEINGFGSQFSDPSNLKGTLASPLDPKLSALANNGGLTQTMALQSDSPALNRIPTQGYTYENPIGGTVVDQRNVVRPRGGAYDIGAYER